MSNQNNKTENSNRPSHYLSIVEGEGDEQFWTKIGAAWPNKDGKGYTLKFSAFPANGGRIIMRDATLADTKAKQDAA